uniref:Uncharacterized protein n=1 Tax=Zea mays TaxID=4577 RepID=C4JAZ6_MAIZE|nr:unknown [Zea mays]
MRDSSSSGFIPRLPFALSYCVALFSRSPWSLRRFLARTGAAFWRFVGGGADARDNAAQEGGGGRRLRRRRRRRRREATALRHAKAAGRARGAQVRRTRLRLADDGAQPDVAARSQALRLAAPLAALTQNQELGFAPPWPRRPRRRHARRTRRMRQEPPARPRAPSAAAVQAAATPRQAPGHPAEGLLPRILGARECGDRCRLQAAAVQQVLRGCEVWSRGHRARRRSARREQPPCRCWQVPRAGVPAGVHRRPALVHRVRVRDGGGAVRGLHLHHRARS